MILDRKNRMPKIIFKNKNNEQIIDVDSDQLTILEIAHQNGINLEGSCEGSMACSTCHIIIEPMWYDKLKKASWDEEDMLDLASGLTLTSRLGCQIVLTKDLDGLVVNLPEDQNDVRLNN
tara:strand:- start:10591 stop:10950 length:360 start_codon:yes stop_codon:yes gene_type:complete